MSEEKKDIKEVVESKLEVAKSSKVFKVAKNAGMVIGGVALGVGISYLLLNGHGDKVIEAAKAATDVAKDVVPEVVEAAI